MLALFEFCYPTQPGNLTERENLRHVPFLFSLRIFVSAFSARTFFQFFPCYLPARLFRNFTFNRRKKVKERSPKRSDKVQFGRWRDSFSSALYALYSDRARSSNQWQRALYLNFNTKKVLRQYKSSRTYPLLSIFVYFEIFTSFCGLFFFTDFLGL